MNALPNLPRGSNVRPCSSDTTNVGVKWPKKVMRFTNYLIAYDIDQYGEGKELLGPT